jgi:hypothetical protein
MWELKLIYVNFNELFSSHDTYLKSCMRVAFVVKEQTFRYVVIAFIVVNHLAMT